MIFSANVMAMVGLDDHGESEAFSAAADVGATRIPRRGRGLPARAIANTIKVDRNDRSQSPGMR
jgi:hypothetical protein